MLRMTGDTLRAWEAKMRPYRKRTPILAVRVPVDFVVVQDGADAEIRGEVVAKAGSWLAKGRYGVYYPISDETFAATYEPIEDHEPSEG